MAGLQRRWPALAIQFGAVLGVIGMVAAQFAMGAGGGQIAFTIGYALVFGVAMLLVTRGALTPSGDDGVPRKEPLKMVLVGLIIIAAVMGLTAAYGIYVAIISPHASDRWLALAYTGVTICAIGATVLVRRARLAYLERYIWPYWHDQDED